MACKTTQYQVAAPKLNWEQWNPRIIHWSREASSYAAADKKIEVKIEKEEVDTHFNIDDLVSLATGSTAAATTTTTTKPSSRKRKVAQLEDDAADDNFEVVITTTTTITADPAPASRRPDKPDLPRQVKRARLLFAAPRVASTAEVLPARYVPQPEDSDDEGEEQWTDGDVSSYCGGDPDTEDEDEEEDSEGEEGEEQENEEDEDEDEDEDGEEDGGQEEDSEGESEDE